MRSKPLPVGLLGPVGISELEPSDSPGGLIQTYAANPFPGLACGRAPIPLGWLHQSPRLGRPSSLDALTNVFRSVDVLAAVGRLGPPQPLRDVSISIPIVLGRPAAIIAVFQSASKV